MAKLKATTKTSSELATPITHYGKTVLDAIRRGEVAEMKELAKQCEQQLSEMGNLSAAISDLRTAINSVEGSQEVVAGGCILPRPIPDFDFERLRISGGGSFSIPGVNIGVGVDISREIVEKRIGDDNLLSIAWLNRGLELSKAVCRVRTPSGSGTGFLVGSNQLMTNNHVIESAQTAQYSIAEFNYQTDWSGNLSAVRRFRILADGFKTNSSNTYDYSIVQVEGNPGDEYGYIDLNDHAIPAVGQNVSIIQHPLGGLKQIALQDNDVVSVGGTIVQYTTDTEPGSSGSPVFDDQWRIVGLHHAGGDMQDPNTGRFHYVNEGILVNSIVNDAREIIDLPDPLLDVAFGGLRRHLLDIVTNNESILPFVPVVAQHPKFGAALNRWILNHMGKEGVSDDQREIAPLLAAAAGVAAGAAIRHWGRRNEVVPSVELSITVPRSITKLVQDVKDAAKSASQIYAAVVGKVDDIRDKLQGVVDSVRGLTEGTREALPVLAAAFLAGVAAGAAAYDGR